MYLIDTNVISEHRKGARAHPGVIRFFATTPNNALYLAPQSIAAIAIVNNLVMVTRDRQLAFCSATAMQVLNPFD